MRRLMLQREKGERHAIGNHDGPPQRQTKGDQIAPLRSSKVSREVPEPARIALPRQARRSSLGKEAMRRAWSIT